MTAPNADTTQRTPQASTDGADTLGAFLLNLQLADSAFPSGRYTRSAGLESFVQAGYLDVARPVEALVELLADYLRYSVGPSDGVALACAHRAVSCCVEPEEALVGVTRVDERLTAAQPAREARTASVRSGKAILNTATAVFTDPILTAYAHRVRSGHPPGNAAVVQGTLTACLGLPRRQALAGELYAFATASAQAAVRLAVLDHRGAQQVLYRLHPVVVEVTAAHVDEEPSRIATNAPLIDVLSMRHERAELRLFAS